MNPLTHPHAHTSSCDAKPPSGTPLSEEEFSSMLRQKYGESDVSILPSPAVLTMEKTPVPKIVKASSPARPKPVRVPGTTNLTSSKQSEVVGPDGKRRIRPISSADAVVAVPAAAASNNHTTNGGSSADQATAAAAGNWTTTTTTTSSAASAAPAPLKDCGTCKYCLDKVSSPPFCLTLF